MFQFTTTNVINSSKDLSTGKELYTFIEEDQENGKPASFNVKRVNNFLAPNIKAIYKAKANDPEMAKVTMAFPYSKIKYGDTVRLSIYVGLSQASQDSRYSNDYFYKGKPFTVEFQWKNLGDLTKSVAAIVKLIEKYQLMVYTEKHLNVSSNQEYITIEATNEFQRFKKVNIEVLNPDTPPLYLGEYIPVKTIEDIEEVESPETLSGQVEGYFVGKEGFGTYSYLLHNIRIPTAYRTRVFGINQEETPVPGAKYNQYTIHYCANRGILGLNAVGEVTKSVTTHVFFVREDLADIFEGYLKQVAEATDGPGKIIEVPAKD